MSAAFSVVIHHNPACGASRNVIAMVRAAGYEPTVINYLETGWTIPQLESLLAAMNAKPRNVLREKGTPAKELGLFDPTTTDDSLLREMVAHPILVNRPIVVTSKGVKLCRPSEVVFQLLGRQPATFAKEDGKIISA